jgi:hypothetical protein
MVERMTKLRSAAKLLCNIDQEEDEQEYGMCLAFLLSFKIPGGDNITYVADRSGNHAQTIGTELGFAAPNLADIRSKVAIP